MRLTTTLILCFATLLAACGPGVDEDADGATIYESVCARCHASDLSGGIGPPLVGADAPSTDLPEEYFVQTISRGNGRMPSFGGTLSEAQIERLVTFILDRQGR